MPDKRKEIEKAIDDLGPGVARMKQEYMRLLERKSETNPEEYIGYMELLRRAKESSEIRTDIEDLNLVLAKRRHDYIEFLKTDIGKKCEPFRQRIMACIEECRNAKTDKEAEDIEERFDAIYDEINALPEKEREILWEKLRRLQGEFARVDIRRRGLKWHFSAFRVPIPARQGDMRQAAPNKIFGKPLFDENTFRGMAGNIARQAYDKVKSHLASVHSDLTVKLDKKREEVNLVFASNAKEAVDETVAPYGKDAHPSIRRKAVKTFIAESCPAMHDELTNRIIFNLAEISSGRNKADAEIYLLQTAMHEYLHLLGGLEMKGDKLDWMAEGIVERISYDILNYDGKKLDWVESGYSPYMSALNWLKDLGVSFHTQEQAYFSRDASLLMEEMKKIGLTATEIERLVDYGARIDIRDDLQTNLHAFKEYAKKLRRRLRGEHEESQELYASMMRAGGIYEKKDLSAVETREDLDRYMKSAFPSAGRQMIMTLLDTAGLSCKLRGIETPTNRDIAEAIQDRLLVLRGEFHAIPTAETYLERFLLGEMDYINRLRFGRAYDREERFEFQNSQKIMERLGIGGSAQACEDIAVKAVFYLWWKNISNPTVSQVMDVLLESMKTASPENIAQHISTETGELISKTQNELYAIHENGTARQELAAYFRSAGYPTDDYVLNSGIKLLDHICQQVYPGNRIIIHPEIGIVRSNWAAKASDVAILDSHMAGRVDGSYDSDRYTYG